MIKKALTISAGMFLLCILGLVVMSFVLIWTDDPTSVHFKILGTFFATLFFSGGLTAMLSEAYETEQKTKGDA